LIAVCRHRPIGVDIEKANPDLPVEELARIALSPGECEALYAQADSDRGGRFLTYWTLKEAYLKGMGVGLSQDPSSVVIDFSANGPIRLRDHTGAWTPRANWRLLSTVAGEYQIALAHQTHRVSWFHRPADL
jgi:4'-phosphopantetheinyl transferase